MKLHYQRREWKARNGRAGLMDVSQLRVCYCVDALLVECPQKKRTDAKGLNG